MNPTLEQFIMALRYRYYVECRPVVSDYSYDIMERLAVKVLPKDSPVNDVGSNSEDSYSLEIKELASKL